ncbi:MULTISPECIES: class I SAM-dependent methyltransferase [Streptomyces]|uniref:Class I SAM-dependent methyltransferase n=1 Tax=Streptomyces mutomycini TaxID=284036 RepID=A0ABW0B1T9_9ACTN|nr:MULTISPECIES: methyltransferase domain-containing protein [Streptomyces]KPC83941.1 ubiquinone biosynthesis methyltransferase UbiE [Streptomyces sp. NRRL S-4]
MTLLRDHDLARAFDHASHSYDRLTALNPGYRSDLLRSARRLGLPRGGRGLRVLDLGCGTGASTRALLGAAPYARITAVDASAGMLERARAKRWPANVRFLHRSAEDLRTTDDDGSYDAVFAAYLFRNVAAPGDVLEAVRALLRPGGRLLVHEYCLSGSAVHRAVWNTVCRGVIIPAGTLTGDRELYHHLWRSVIAFDTAPLFAQRISLAGFPFVRTVPVGGWQTGIVHTFLARSGTGSAGPEAS